ncbi:MobF family relaxase [Bradyrhizobium sp. BR13661]|uniref:MobF family relaxase n=2 Tax=Pseudomonadota TaxID=1224 RepID=UPI0024744E05|nr:MobF family relaxase [Bradyrhizobium sp. BR13661]MDH6263858.1 conjugative relaxase-like TrwC/TraI family protein [Bradyrhizobium sp. BR13661]
MVATWSIAADASYYPREAERDRRGSYYEGGREPPGVWYAPQGDFGLVDGAQVDPVVFQRLYAGLAADGTPLNSSAPGRRGNRVPAYDITFSVPRSLALIWALASPELRTELDQALARAARTSLDLLEREGTYARRGRNGIRVERVPLSAAMYRHGESRPSVHDDGKFFADPNWHLHCVALNLATRADGTVGGLHSIAQRDLKMTLGAQVHAAWAYEVQALGFEIDRIGPNGVFEIKGVDQAHIDYFSGRRQEIKNELKKYGLASTEAPALAGAIAKATRGSKDKVASRHREEIWAEAAKAHGIDVEHYVDNLRHPDHILDHEASERLLAERLTELPRLLTENQSVIERKDLLRAVASALVGTGLPTTQIDVEIQRLLDTQAFVEIGRDQLDRPRYSTPEMLVLEREVVACAARLAARDGFALDADRVRARCAQAGLSGEQIEAALAMAGASAITVVAGAPGSGKTTTIGPVVALYEESGQRRVLGAATAWKTATALQSDFSIPARALASWLEKARHGGDFLRPGDVLVLDEAGLVNSRDMALLLATVERAGAKLICVGDPKQLQAIGGPGLSLVQRAIETARVETIVRQHDQWQRDAIHAFGNGRAEEALTEYAHHGHLKEADGYSATIATMVESWREKRAAHPASEPLLLARTNADVSAISVAVRGILRSEGRITGPDVVFAAVTPSGQATKLALARGDRICFRTRNDALGVINGTIGTVLGVKRILTDTPDEQQTVRIEALVAGRRITFSPDDIADHKGRARLSWAYASTTYQAQGVTVDNAIVFVDPAFDRHQIYVAASRARKSTNFVIDATSIDKSIAAELPLDQQVKATAPSSEERLAWLAKRLSLAHVRETTLDAIELDVAVRREAGFTGLSLEPETQQKRSKSREASFD